MANEKITLKSLQRVGAFFEKILNVLCIFLLSVIAVCVVIQVIFREASIPVVWFGELSTFSTIWLVFLGLALGYKHDMLAQVDIIFHLLPQKIRPFLSILWDILALVIMGIVVISSRSYISFVMASKTVSPELQLPLWFVYLGPILGYFFTMYYAFCNIVIKASALRSQDDTNKGKSTC